MEKFMVVKERIAKLRQKMAEKRINLAVIAKPENVFYFSQFNSILNSHPCYVIIPLEGEPCLLVHCIRGDHAREEGAMENIQFYSKWGNKIPVDMNPVKAIAKIAAAYSLGKVSLGLECSYLSTALYQQLDEVFQQPHIESISVDCEELKMVKDDFEIDLIKKSALLADCGMAVMIESLRSGASEAECCTEAQYAMRKLWQKEFHKYEISGFGGQDGGIIDALNCWCLTGGRISYGCDCPNQMRATPGELVLPIVWAKLGGYHTENERTLYIPELDEFKTRAYQAMLAARKQVLTMIRPGITFESLYLAAIEIFKEAGFADILPGRVGHGIGLSAHEFPSLTKGNQILLQPGMVFTVEPGLMAVPWGGVRHSDTVLVTESGCKILTKVDSGILTI